MIEFNKPDILFLLLLLIPLVLAMGYYLLWRKRRMRRIASDHLMHQIAPHKSTRRLIYKLSFILLATTLIIFAAARPITGSKVKTEKTAGADVVFCIDLSTSMNAEDLLPNRLFHARQAVLAIMNNLQNNKMGLIIFAGEAFVKVPLTPDRQIMQMQLNSLSTNEIQSQGTNISAAIKMARKSFPENNALHDDLGKVIVLITDGEDHEGDAIIEAEHAKNDNITIYSIGIGTPKGTPIPVTTGSGQKTFKKDKEGNVVVSRLNEDLLRDIVNASKGKFYISNIPRQAASNIAKEINKMNTNAAEITEYSEYLHLFHYFTLPALLLLMIDLIIPLSVRKRVLHKIVASVRIEKDKNITK